MRGSRIYLKGKSMKSGLRNNTMKQSANNNMVSLSGAENWFSDGSKLTNLRSTFSFNLVLADISALSNWDVLMKQSIKKE